MNDEVEGFNLICGLCRGRFNKLTRFHYPKGFDPFPFGRSLCDRCLKKEYDRVTVNK